MGVFINPEPLPLYRGRDYERTFVAHDPVTQQPVPFPAGQLYIELCGAVKKVFQATISGPNAVFKIESEDCDKIADRTKYQLVWQATGEPAGGQCVGFGQVKVVTGCGG
jgi:hypothetical protein